VNYALGTSFKEYMSCFKVLAQYFPVGTEEKHETLSQCRRSPCCWSVHCLNPLTVHVSWADVPTPIMRWQRI